MKVPVIDLKAQYVMLRDELLAAVDAALSGMQLNLGPNVQAFEREFGEYCGVDHALGVGNGTEALLLALEALDIGPGDEVITVSWSFIATIEAIVHAGAKPVVVDVCPDTYCMDPDCLGEAITDKTRAILPVHIFGHPADMDGIEDAIGEQDIAIIEDAAQAHGALYKGRPVGSVGTCATFSFYPTKNLAGYGESGMITTDSDELFERLALLRDHGHRAKYEHAIIGRNARMDEIQAAMLRVKMQYLDEWNQCRREIAASYDELLEDLPVTTPHEADWAKHAYHLYTIRTDHRERLTEAFEKAEVGYMMHYKAPPHRQPACRPYGLGDVDLPVTETLAEQVVQLPMHPLLKQEEVEYVCDVVRSALA